MASSARFLVQIGAQPQRNFPIERDITIAGREAINDLVLNDAEVSRRHTRILREPEGYLVEDLGSTNGTFVNGKRVTVPTLLYHGDIVELGKSVRLIFQLDQPYEQVTKPIEMERAAPPPPPITPSAEPENVYAPRYEEPYAPEPRYEPAVERPSRPIYEEAFSEYQEEDSAEFYRPPSAPVIVGRDDNSYDDPDDESGGCQRYFITCGCLSLLFIFLLGAALFTLDALAPDLLYCGRLQGFWEAILRPVLNLTGRVWVCP